MSFTPKLSRRHALRSLAGGSMLMSGVVSQLLARDALAVPQDPLVPRAPHFKPRAKNVIMLYMTGGVSHIDTFDPKPRLNADHGKVFSVPGKNDTGDKRKIKRSDYAFARHGKAGTWVSELFPHMATCVDDLAVIRSMRTDHRDHVEASLGIHTGSVTFTRPSMGSWVSYGLGTFNQNLPSFVVIAPHLPYGGSQAWASDFLPGVHQGTRVVPGDNPVPNVRPALADASLQTLELRRLHAVNRRHLARNDGDALLDARVKAFETAAGMQLSVPDAFDLSREDDHTLSLYGMQRGENTGFGWQCLAARRLIEKGVRFVEVIDKSSDNLAKRNWDAHSDMGWYGGLARDVDQPIAGLLKDLKQRGMLDDTLVIWTTEFGRTPFEDGGDGKGRGHWPHAFTSWLAGAGVKPGIVHGETDAYGAEITSGEVHVHDFHATVLHLLGMDHTRLTFQHGGRDYRLTDVAGKVVSEVMV